MRVERRDQPMPVGSTDRRLKTLRAEITAWSIRVNEKQRGVDWQFTIDKARVKLKRLYPKV